MFLKEATSGKNIAFILEYFNIYIVGMAYQSQNVNNGIPAIELLNLFNI